MSVKMWNEEKKVMNFQRAGKKRKNIFIAVLDEVSVVHPASFTSLPFLS
jgi:hypothetical protein